VSKTFPGLTLTGCIDFLRSQAPDKEYKCGSAYSCPLADYFRHLAVQSFPGKSLSVCVTQTEHCLWLGAPYAPQFDSKQVFKNDEWMVRGISRVDRAIGRKITAAEALEVFLALEREEK
jgi:hypothetical protein